MASAGGLMSDAFAPVMAVTVLIFIGMMFARLGRFQ